MAIAWQAMKDRNLPLSAMAAEMESSRAQLNRALDPDAVNVTWRRSAAASACHRFGAALWTSSPAPE